MRSKIFKLFFHQIILIVCVSYLTGCAQKKDGKPMHMQMSVPVVGFKALKQPIAEKISLVGNLEANEIVDIKNEIDGAVEEIKFEEGQKVKKGDLLFLIDQRKLQAFLDQAQANLKLAETTTQRYQSLVASGAISRQELDQANATLQINQATVELYKAQLGDSTIIAPFDGVMGERKVSVGQYISKGMNLSHLISQDPIKANFHFPERYLSRVKLGQRVEIKVATYPDETFQGEVYFIDPQIDEMTRTALIKAKLANSEDKLRHGMFANLKLTVNEKENAIVVPETALILKGDDVFVYTVGEDSTVAIKAVKVGIRLAGFVEIEQGIAQGETVVIEGYQKIFPGVKANVRFEEDQNEVNKSGAAISADIPKKESTQPSAVQEQKR